ncbi:hypothetical protein KBC55_02020 [Patescibacteria group bacterium]|nr:hypothetical protein [Patescibacteria group bacterium]
MAFGVLLAIVFILTHVANEAIVSALPYPWGLISLTTVVGCYVAYRTQALYAAVYLGMAAFVQITSLHILGSFPYLGAALAVYLTATFVFAKRSLIAYIGIAAAGCLTQALVASMLEPSYSGVSQLLLRFILTFFIAITFGIAMDALLRRFGRSFMTRGQL